MVQILPEISTDFSKWRIFFCDERLVPFSDEDSTFGFYKKNLMPLVPLTEDQFFTINANDNIETCAEDYEKSLKIEFNQSSEIPKFDLLLLGMGNDGWNFVKNIKNDLYWWMKF